MESYFKSYIPIAVLSLNWGLKRTYLNQEIRSWYTTLTVVLSGVLSTYGGGGDQTKHHYKSGN